MEKKHIIPVPPRPQSGRKTAREMFPLVEQWLESGEKQLDFCAAHDLTVATLGYWLKKYRNQNAAGPRSGKFVSLTVSPSSTRGEIEISYPNGVKIRAGITAGASFLRELAGQC